MSTPRLREFLLGYKMGTVENGYTQESVDKCNADDDFKSGYDAACDAQLDAVTAFLSEFEVTP